MYTLPSSDQLKNVQKGLCSFEMTFPLGTRVVGQKER